MRVVFPYLAQAHQILHSLPIAAAMAERQPDVAVHVAAVNAAHLDFARRMVTRHAPAARLHFDQLTMGPGDALRLKLGLGRHHFKQYTMLANRGYFADFDAVVTPERTSLFLKRLQLDAALIWTRHGAGDREIGFADDVDEFDFVLIAGRKIEARLLEAQLIRPGRFLSGVYAKFDWARRQGAERLFANDRPTVLYNPHFESHLSSWPRYGRAVLDWFAANSRYNLIFAPHIRLFDPPTARERASFERYAALPHVRIDLGSECSIDMTYSQAADIYLGDVSSQVAEFVSTPRPCLFLDAHATRWQDDPNYRFWQLGPVIESPDALEAELAAAIELHPVYRAAQQDYVTETFGLGSGPSAPRGAAAIMAYLQGRAGASSSASD